MMGLTLARNKVELGAILTSDEIRTFRWNYTTMTGSYLDSEGMPMVVDYNGEVSPVICTSCGQRHDLEALNEKGRCSKSQQAFDEAYSVLFRERLGDK